MLQLQLKDRVGLNLSKKITFFFQLFLFSTFFHACFLASFFLIDNFKKSIVLNTLDPDVEIVFVPLMKTAQIIQAAPLKPTSALEKKTANISASKKQIDMQKKIEVKKEVESHTITKKAIQKNKKEPIKKVVPKKQSKQEVPKKQEPVKQSNTNEKEVVKAPSDTVNQEEKRSKLLVGVAELDLIVMQEELKKTIAQDWKRPSNIPVTALCCLKVKLNNHGKCEAIIEKSSGSLALDISARNFLLSFKFSEQWYGKEFSIIF